MPGFIHNRRLVIPGGAVWTPLRLFANGEAGAWYDPSDLTTMFQDYTGTAAAVDSPVKLILDKSQGELHSLGSELVTNGTFDTDTGWTLGTGWTISGGDLSYDGTDATNAASVSGLTLTSGAHYKWTFDLTLSQGALLVRPTIGSSTGQQQVTSSGSYTFYVRGAGAAPGFVSGSFGGRFIGSVDNVSIKKVPGNHAYQDTDTKRTMLRQSGGLYYLEFDGVDDTLVMVDDSLDFNVSTLAVAGKIRTAGASGYKTAILADKQIIYARTDANGRWGTYNGVEIESSYAATSNSVLMLRTRAANDLDLITNGVVENKTTGTVLNQRAPGIGASGSQIADLNFYGGLIINRVVSDAEVSRLNTYFSAKAGL